MALSFAKDIRPLFRDTPDVDSMKEYGLDLSSCTEVKDQAENIYLRLLDGSMPCDSSWSQEHLALFKRWMDEGMAPRVFTRSARRGNHSGYLLRWALTNFDQFC